MQNSLNDALVKLNLTQNDSQTNPFIEKLEKEFRKLILHCQEASELSRNLGLKGKLPIQFPRIVVVGCESAGKSSVIERLAGFGFFPVCEGITTRMPISMSLKLASRDKCRRICSEHGLRFYSESTIPLVGLKARNAQVMKYYMEDDIALKIQDEMREHLGQYQKIISFYWYQTGFH